jgi:hypothetical protein
LAQSINVPQGQLLLQRSQENFFSYLKEELFYHVRFLKTDALETALHDCIHWCNTERIPTMLKGLSPVQYRAQALAAKALT